MGNLTDHETDARFHHRPRGDARLSAPGSQQVIEQIPLLLIILDKEGVIKGIEGGELRTLQLDPADLIGTHAFRNRKIPVQKGHFRKALKGEQVTAVQNIDGQFYETLYLLDQSPQTESPVIAYVTNITERIRVELELDEKVYQKTVEIEHIRRAQTEMLDHMKQGILTFDEDLIINEAHSRYDQVLVEGEDALLHMIEDLIINEAHSRYLLELLGEEESPAGASVLEKIVQRTDLDKSASQRLEFDLVTVFGGCEIQWLCSSWSLPDQINFTRGDEVRHFRTTWEPITRRS